RLAVCVVCIAAFASGCGGGGGGGGSATMPDPEPPTMPEPTEPTDAERIAAARQEVASILANAQARAGAASSAAAAIGTNPDATPAQITDAIGHSNAAQSALALIVSANTAATLATTPAEANAALANAKAAESTLNASASAISNIQGAVQAAANQRRQREEDEMALTGGSSLIRHLRDNKLLADAVLGAAGANLTGDSLVVAATGANPSISSGARTACVEPCAEYPANTEGANRVTGQRTVRIQPTGATAALVSDSTTPPLTGTGRLPHGFDLNNGTTNFVNAYTDIAHQERKGTKTDVEEDVDTTLYDERYNYIIDTDYLLAGIWLTVDPANLSASRITAFAYGSQAIPASPHNFCVGDENAGVVTDEPTRSCRATTLNSISGFVDEGKDLTATYRGNANGAYLAGSDTSYFTGDVTLTAEFRNPTGTGTDGEGSIEGAVTNIVAGGQQMAGSIELQKHTFATDAIEAGFGDDAVGVVDGKSFSGSWKGQFFGMRHTKSVVTNRAPDPDVITTTYKAQAPGSVAGTFYATQQSNPAGSAAFIGSFAAHR
ncbi:MAG: hypothetical protein OXL41_09245, partial [Nitrospinae bacterium]|nr:hypothetical protein [Nitrospinota bacterium]